MYLDSAVLADAVEAEALGFVRGITTNPALLAKAGAKSPLDHLNELLAVFSGSVFFQPVSTETITAEAEARDAVAFAPERVVIKLLATAPFVSVASRLTAEGIPCALTAVYSAGQALAANDAGCAWVIPYVDRAERLSPSEGPVVTRLRKALANRDGTGILAASIKSAGQAVSAIQDGADDFSAGLDVLQAVCEHGLTQSAAAEFEEVAGQGPGHVGEVCPVGDIQAG